MAVRELSKCWVFSSVLGERVRACDGVPSRLDILPPHFSSMFLTLDILISTFWRRPILDTVQQALNLKMFGSHGPFITSNLIKTNHAPLRHFFLPLTVSALYRSASSYRLLHARSYANRLQPGYTRFNHIPTLRTCTVCISRSLDLLSTSLVSLSLRIFNLQAIPSPYIIVTFNQHPLSPPYPLPTTSKTILQAVSSSHPLSRQPWPHVIRPSTSWLGPPVSWSVVVSSSILFPPQPSSFSLSVYQVRPSHRCALFPLRRAVKYPPELVFLFVSLHFLNLHMNHNLKNNSTTHCADIASLLIIIHHLPNHLSRTCIHLFDTAAVLVSAVLYDLLRAVGRVTSCFEHSYIDIFPSSLFQYRYSLILCFFSCWVALLDIADLLCLVYEEIVKS